jgi:hypothetical protein
MTEVDWAGKSGDSWLRQLDASSLAQCRTMAPAISQPSFERMRCIKNRGSYLVRPGNSLISELRRESNCSSLQHACVVFVPNMVWPIR